MSMMQPNPGAVSGPGRLSQRTDLPPAQGAKKLPDAAYGEQAQFQQDQAGAPMAGSARQMPEVIPLGAPTRRPDEPVTAGVNAGPGPGSEILGLKTPADVQVEDLSKLAELMPLMASFADSPQSSGTMKAFVKYLRSQSE
jgi:hypothetical protein